MNDLLAPWEATPDDPFDLRKVGHLVRRAGFGASLRTRRDLVRKGPAAAVAHVVATATPDGDAEAERLEAVLAFDDLPRVRAYRVWLALQDDRSLQQRLTGFWHGHFATSNRKVEDPRAMALQMATFDRLGAGAFDELLAAVCRDPAMLRWLDNDTNTSRHPNENFARELFELFTLGRGNYGEQDVREAARCFTGWHVRDGRFHFHPHLHDTGAKTVFGATAAMGGERVLELVVARPESARFLAAKLLRCFVHPEPEPAEVEAVATVYEANGRRIGAVLAILLRSRLFFSRRAYRSKVKSPADLVLGTVRALGAFAAPSELAAAMASMGESWLEPPSVEGWHGERAWLSPAAWLLRSNFVADLLARRRGKLRPGPAAVFTGLDSVRDRCRAATLLLLDGDVPPAALASLARVAEAQERAGADPDAAAAALLHATSCLPEYQLS